MHTQIPERTCLLDPFSAALDNDEPLSPSLELAGQHVADAAESADDDMIAQRLDLMAHVFDAKYLLDPRDGDELHEGAREKDQANLQNRTPRDKSAVIAGAVRSLTMTSATSAWRGPQFPTGCHAAQCTTKQSVVEMSSY
jgi:hypothetical protein